MQWLTETIITLTPLALGIIILAAMAAGWVLYALRGYKYWWRRFHRYGKVPSRRQMKRNYGYVEYVPEVVNIAPRPVRAASPRRIKSRQPQIITKPVPQRVPMAPITPTPVVAPEPEPIYSTKDDLQVVEGIGPKIEEILNGNGIYTWRELAATPISNLEQILERAGKRFQMHNPMTWGEQAAMADQGKWDELRVWQDNLHGGIQTKKA